MDDSFFSTETLRQLRRAAFRSKCFRFSTSGKLTQNSQHFNSRRAVGKRCGKLKQLLYSASEQSIRYSASPRPLAHIPLRAKAFLFWLSTRKSAK
jgi:hypothetical protein